MPQSCYFLGELSLQGRKWISSSVMSDVYCLVMGNKRAALKIVRTNVDHREKMAKVRGQKGASCYGLLTIHQKFYHEAIMWRHLQHPHIVPFLGVAGSHESAFTLVSEWMPHGTIAAFLQRRPTENRLVYVRFKSNIQSIMTNLRFPQIRDIIRGLRYLHMLGIIHGDLKSVRCLRSNVLMCLRKSLGKHFGRRWIQGADLRFWPNNRIQWCMHHVWN